MIATPTTVDRRNDPEQAGQARLHLPMGRPGEPHEIATVARVLASDAASYVSGSTYFADGGLLQSIGGA